MIAAGNFLRHALEHAFESRWTLAALLSVAIWLAYLTGGAFWTRLSVRRLAADDPRERWRIYHRWESILCWTTVFGLGATLFALSPMRFRRLAGSGDGMFLLVYILVGPPFLGIITGCVGVPLQLEARPAVGKSPREAAASAVLSGITAAVVGVLTLWACAYFGMAPAAATALRSVFLGMLAVLVLALVICGATGLISLRREPRSELEQPERRDSELPHLPQPLPDTCSAALEEAIRKLLPEPDRVLWPLRLEPTRVSFEPDLAIVDQADGTRVATVLVEALETEQAAAVIAAAMARRLAGNLIQHGDRRAMLGWGAPAWIALFVWLVGEAYVGRLTRSHEICLLLMLPTAGAGVFCWGWQSYSRQVKMDIRISRRTSDPYVLLSALRRLAECERERLLPTTSLPALSPRIRHLEHALRTWNEEYPCE